MVHQQQAQTSSTGADGSYLLFLFKCAVKHASTDNYRIMAATEMGTPKVSLEDAQTLVEMSAEDVDMISSNLCDVFAQVMKGGSFTLVRGVGNANGIEAWRRIHQNASPSTQATALADLMRVMFLGRAKQHRKLLTRIEKWGIRVDAPSRDQGENCSRK